MIEIKFRGKRTDNGKWIYGYYVCRGGQKHQIVSDDSLFPFQVSPKTVGQFTGLKDINGNDIYEGDYLRQKTHPCSQNKDSEIDYDPLFDRYETKWDSRKNGWNAFPISALSAEDFDTAIQQLGGLITWPCEDVLCNSQHYKIIGNTSDNPELLQK
jgi:uncharacterized phage protein (TIGR01671 family)